MYVFPLPTFLSLILSLCFIPNQSGDTKFIIELIEQINIRKMFAAIVVLTGVIISVIGGSWAWKLFNWVWLKPRKLEIQLRKQGLNGNPYRFMAGDIKDSSRMRNQEREKPIPFTNDYFRRVLPFLHQQLNKYGKNCFIWLGPVPAINITDPDLIREGLTKINEFRKAKLNPLAGLLAPGLVSYEGEKWAMHRKLIHPAFHMEKLKLMLTAFSASISETINTWEKTISGTGGSAEIDVWPYLTTLSADVISRAAFGSSYQEGRRIFELLKEQTNLTVRLFQSVYIPGWKYVPTKTNKRMKDLNAEIQRLLKGIIDKRKKAMEAGEPAKNDLLGILMESNFKQSQSHECNNNKQHMSFQDMMDECKLFYFAGQETTSVLLVWTLILLSKHQNWQTRAREEVLAKFGKDQPDFDGLNHLKTVTMILHEVLRLYPPIHSLSRKVYNDGIKLGDLVVPNGAMVSMLILHAHQDPKLWGDDALEFNPQRFSEGISKATNATERKALKMLRGELAAIFVTFIVVLIARWGWKTLNRVWFKPRKLERELRKQGLNGNHYRFLVGDIKDSFSMRSEQRKKPIPFTNDYFGRVLPFLHQQRTKYGRNSFNWMGPVPVISITEPELIRDALTRMNEFPKPKLHPLIAQLASGLASYEAQKWTKHRKLINPAFHIEKLKLMLPAFSASITETVNQWEKLVSSSTTGSSEVDVWPYLMTLSADVISRAAFGSSYEEGSLIFQLLKEQTELIIRIFQKLYIPGWKYMPTKDNKRMKEAHNEILRMLTGIIEKRNKAIEAGEPAKDDLLGILLESNYKETNLGMTFQEIIDECKLFYFAGQETTSVLLVWTMILLSKHQDWQTRARQEVLEKFGKDQPDFDGLNHLKTVTMILYEVLRLYPPAISVNRAVNNDGAKLGNLQIPKGVTVELSILSCHQDPKLWGNDALEFNPDRFSEGIAKATQGNMSFFPFGWGPRICIGQNFAITEAKMALAMILQRFSFELSPSYAHAPTSVITLQPQYGAHIILHQL